MSFYNMRTIKNTNNNVTTVGWILCTSDKSPKCGGVNGPARYVICRITMLLTGNNDSDFLKFLFLFEWQA